MRKDPIELGALSGLELDEWFEARESQQQALAPPDLLRKGYTLHTESERLSFLNQVYAEVRASTPELHYYRTMVFWRTTRWLLMQKGMLQPGQRLSDALQNNPKIFLWRSDHYIHPVYGDDALRGLMHAQLPVHPRYCEKNEERQKAQAMHLLTALHLNITRGSPKLPSYGQLGLRDMDGPIHVFINLFPTEMEIVSFEEEAVMEAADKMALNTKRKAEKILTHKYGFSYTWCKDLMTMASDVLIMRSSYSHEQKKAMMVHRLESVIDRAQKSLDIMTEMRALKMLAQVEGLNTTAESDQRRSLIQLYSEEPPQITEET